MQKLLDKNIYTSLIITSILLVVFSTIGFTMELKSNQIEQVVKYSATQLFIHNTELSLYNFLGVFSLGIYNFFILLFNSIEIGYALKFGIVNHGLTITLLKFLPHAIFELPSIILSVSSGFLPLIILINYTREKHFDKSKLFYYAKYLTFSVLIVLVLNILAGIFESLISMKF